MATIDDETDMAFLPEWWIRYIRDSRNHLRKILEARKENFERLGIKP